MIFRLGRFELDESTRELRLGSRAMEMQPRMFDLLVYLVRHHDRVVPKEELLSALWPGVIVTDSSLMRAVSLIRSVMRDGGQPEAIRNFSRRGYRYVGDVGETVTAATTGDLARARTASGNSDWQQALKAFQKAQHARDLQAADFEQWAHAALYVGQPDDAVVPLERAVAAHMQNADRVGAARAALQLANVHIEGRELAVAKGWHRRAGAFLADEESNETKEYGLLLWLSARIAFFERNLPVALDWAKRAETFARRIKDADVEALGLIYRGHVELATGETRTGLVHLDEAGAATLAGTVGPWVSGIVFCSIIWAYLDRGDLNRAGQWTDQFTRWAERNTGFGAPGLCRLHRGEVLCNQGKLQAAESEIRRASELLAKSARYAEGDAYRVLGEIRLLRGDLVGADTAFRQAHELGWQSTTGRALLQEEKGDLGSAIKLLQRGLRFPTWVDGQRRGIQLAHLARIAALAGKLPLAKQTLAELNGEKELRVTAGCEAEFHRAAAEVAFAHRRPEEAIRSLREALVVWMNVASLINVAHTRLRLAAVLALSGDPEEAELELSIARKAFSKMSAPAMVARCDALDREIRTKLKK